jgi:hypothetical protein
MNNNNLELKYLTNQAYKQSIKQKQLTLHPEVDKYTERILDLTKLLSNKHEINLTLQKAYIEYTNICIDYLKEIDLNKLIQEDLVDINIAKKKTHIIKPLDKDVNKTIYNEKNRYTLDQFISIKKSKQEVFFIPKKKNI